MVAINRIARIIPSVPEGKDAVGTSQPEPGHGCPLKDRSKHDVSIPIF
jgi:hypothetical protein